MNKGRIILVDDEETVLISLGSILKDYNFSVQTAASAQELFSLPDLSRADLILLDVNMPEVDGYECCRRLKADQLTARIPVIFLSGISTPFSMVKGFEAGAVDYIGKPFQIEEIISRITTHVKLKKNQEELEKSKKNAEKAAAVKSQFLASMSHEIRTPLNALMGVTNLLRYTDLTPDQLDYVQKMESVSKNLLNIINDILDVAKIDAGKIRIENIDFTINQLFNELKDLIQHKAGEKKLEVLYRVSPEIPDFLQGDPYRLGQILLNLVNNSLKFTSEGEIVISVDLVEKKNEDVFLQFSVKDSGIGMTLAQQRKIFAPFSQADSSTTRLFGGTGLGLTICRQLVTLMGGQIKVRSRSGKGAEFIFTVKCKTAQTEQPDPGLHCPPHLRHKRILVVDDNVSAREIFKTYLENFGYLVTVVTNGKEAISEFLLGNGNNANIPYALILMDYKLPDLNGVAAFKQIRKLASLPQPPVILVSSSGRPEVAERVTKAGMSGFLIKPVTPAFLFETAAAVLEGKKSGLKKLVKPDFSNLLRGLQRRHILLTEDNQINQEVIKDILEKEDFKVSAAHNGRVCLKTLRKKYKEIDVIFMDLHMPEMDGYAALKAIRSEPNYKDIPVIALTADARQEVCGQVLKQGFAACLTKPFTLKELYKLLALVLKGKKETVYLQDPVKAEQQDDAGAEENIAALRLIDAAAGLKRLSGHQTLYYKLLRDFSNTYKNAAAELRKYGDKNDFSALKFKLHALKGAAGNLSLLRLYQYTIYLERKIKELDSSAFKTDLRELENIFRLTFKEIKKLLSASGEENEK